MDVFVLYPLYLVVFGHSDYFSISLSLPISCTSFHPSCPKQTSVLSLLLLLPSAAAPPEHVGEKSDAHATAPPHPPGADVRHLFQEELLRKGTLRWHAVACAEQSGVPDFAGGIVCHTQKAQRIQSTVLAATREEEKKKRKEEEKLPRINNRKRRAITLRNKKRIYLFSFHFLPPLADDASQSRKTSSKTRLTRVDLHFSVC